MATNGSEFALENLIGASGVRGNAEEVFFRVGNKGMFCRLLHVGTGVWRLEANARGKKFDDYGAAQQLARYMGEELTETAGTLSAKAVDGVLTVTAGDGTSVKIGGKPFAIDFFSADGKLVSSLKKIATVKGAIKVVGDFEKKEAVYGAGEKFDVVNRRGTSCSLYTGDMWNNTKGTYMAIPLFLFTRGAGLFFNHYQNMYADMGEARKNEWSITLHNKSLDLYVTATGDIKDAIVQYTDLTGHALKPAEWNYGPVICRYGPDFNHLWEKDDKPDTVNNDKAPSGRGFETIVNKFRKADMPLTAVITEGWGFGGIFGSKEEKARWQEALDWLHANNVKAMCYMRVASSLPQGEFAGFKEEYLVRATVTIDGVAQETTKIPDTAGDGVNPDSRRGATHQYVDITNPKAMKWYVDTIWGELIKMGFDGVKIDFCETFPDSGVNYGGMTVKYHWHNPAKIAKGTEHHAYPSYFISQFFKRMNELKAKKYGGSSDGFMVLSRGGGIGSQRNPYLWGGDQVRSFDKLDDQLMCTINCGLSGVPFMTYDMAGYRYGGMKFDAPDTLGIESRVFARAVDYTAFTTCIQTHGTVRNAFELEQFAQDTYRNFVKLHLELVPHIDKYSAIAAETGIPAVRHPVLKYPQDEKVYSLADEFLLGDGLLVAPILADNVFERKVYLPAGTWINALTGKTVEGGRTISVKANIGQTPVFLDKNSVDFDFLSKVFSGKNWKAIKNFKA